MQGCYLASTVGTQQAEELVVLNGKPGVLDCPVLLGQWASFPLVEKAPQKLPEEQQSNQPNIGLKDKVNSLLFVIGGRGTDIALQHVMQNWNAKCR